MNARDVVQAERDLLWLIEHAADLADARVPGTRRPLRRGRLSPEVLARMDALARQERAERSGVALAAAPAPVHVDLLDLAVALLADADMLAELTARHAGLDPLPPASSAYADPAPYLAFTRKHLHTAVEAEPDLAEVVAETAAAYVVSVSGALNLLIDGHQLPGLCPWCGGRDARHPVGGALTLVVRLLPVLDNEPAVVCYGDCHPPSADCGTRYRGRPAWPDYEWTWLAKRIEDADARRDGTGGTAA